MSDTRNIPIEVDDARPGAGVGRSRKLSRKAQFCAGVPMTLFLGFVIWSNSGWANLNTAPLVAFYSLIAVLVLFYMFSGTAWRTFKHLPVAQGRVLVIVPSYNEEPELLRNTVKALCRQTRPPDAIYVIDDGSKTPLETFDHPLVTWVRQDNGGKRHAQATILEMVKDEHWDFILTVDSDSVCDDDALEHMLRAMSNPKIQACTGMLLVRNWNDNFHTRLIDINVVTSCLLMRMARSHLGAVCPTSGALALYRAEIIYDNLYDYLNSGTVGDDRRLSLYALMRGDVVAVNEAVVETALPNTWRATFKQRLRWSKSAWLAVPFVITNMRMAPLFFYVYPLAFALLWPATIVVVLIVTISIDHMLIVYSLEFWVIIAFTETMIYALYRPGLRTVDRLSQLGASLFLPLLGLGLLRPAMYKALTELRSQAWATRDVDLAAGPAAGDTADEQAMLMAPAPVCVA
jgi:hyaluronan synthase